MWAIRDRLVVRSSVIPSARYCCSGSLLRLENGNTIIDKRGAAGCVIDVVVAATVAGSVEEDLVRDQPHQATTARTSAANPAATTARGMDRRCRGVPGGTLVTGNSAIASGRNAKTR